MLKHQVRLSVEEAYQAVFQPTAFNKMTKRRTGSKKTAYGDGLGHEISEGQLLNQIRDEMGDAKGNVPAIGLKTVKEGNQLFVVVSDESKLSKVTYGRLDDGTPTIAIK